ncbi:MAG TPA: hypothetical protein VEI97_07945, partial [bacterium]|nr:hypothetical protein [bacterium]
MRLLTLALCIALASGCAGGAPTVPSEGLATPTPSPANPFTGGGGDLDRPMGRTGAGDISGTVTLNGATTTNPTYQTAPFKVAQDGRADDIALFALNAIAIPAANNAVRTHFDGASTAYGFLDYPTTGTTGYLALYLTKSELISLTFLNSPTLATPLHSQAVKWAGSFRTIGREDAFEADDDENAASLGDRPANAPLLGT